MTHATAYRAEVPVSMASTAALEGFRLRPLTALRALLRLFKNKEDTVQVFEIMRALSGNSVPRGYQRLISTPQGGAIALGHPLGATGALRTATLVHGMRRTKQKWGVVTMCIGTGMGAAGLFEAL